MLQSQKWKNIFQQVLLSKMNNQKFSDTWKKKLDSKIAFCSNIKVISKFVSFRNSFVNIKLALLFFFLKENLVNL